MCVQDTQSVLCAAKTITPARVAPGREEVVLKRAAATGAVEPKLGSKEEQSRKGTVYTGEVKIMLGSREENEG